jgi:1,4-dihydroxy-2-naphthoate octaprenyltransferase
MAKLLAFLRAARLHFLLDGAGLFALGAMIARYEGWEVTPSLYSLGQAFVTALQLMSHFLNEYWDAESDRRNQRRTLFSGGSGVLPEAALTRETIFAAGAACLAIALAVGALIIVQRSHPALWVVMGLIVLGLIFQSTPPVALTSSGYGELTTSIVYAGLVPALAHLLWSNNASPLVLLATAPLVTLHIAMLIAFGLPDFESDRAGEKRTLVVRLGQERALSLHNALLVLALLLAALGTFSGLPARVAISGAIVAPLVVLQISLGRRLRDGQSASFAQLTLLAAIIFGLGAYLFAFSFWVIG